MEKGGSRRVKDSVQPQGESAVSANPQQALQGKECWSEEPHTRQKEPGPWITLPHESVALSQKLKRTLTAPKTGSWEPSLHSLHLNDKCVLEGKYKLYFITCA